MRRIQKTLLGSVLAWQTNAGKPRQVTYTDRELEFLRAPGHKGPIDA